MRLAWRFPADLIARFEMVLRFEAAAREQVKIPSRLGNEIDFCLRLRMDMKVNFCQLGVSRYSSYPLRQV